jgi:hypothetical protein
MSPLFSLLEVIEGLRAHPFSLLEIIEDLPAHTFSLLEIIEDLRAHTISSLEIVGEMRAHTISLLEIIEEMRAHTISLLEIIEELAEAHTKLFGKHSKSIHALSFYTTTLSHNDASIDTTPQQRKRSHPAKFTGSMEMERVTSLLARSLIPGY